MKEKQPQKENELHMSAKGFDNIMRRVFKVTPPIKAKVKPKVKGVKKIAKKSSKH